MLKKQKSDQISPSSRLQNQANNPPESRDRARKENNSRSLFLRGRHAASRVHRQHALEKVRGALFGVSPDSAVKVDVAGADDVEADTLVGVFTG